MASDADGWSAAPLIAQLLAPRKRPGEFVQMHISDIMNLCVRARAVFKAQPVLLELGAPVKLCGDIHGQYHDLLKIFETAGYPPGVNYLFLGDYVDRGRQSLETICLLFALKVEHPESIFLLRGNHEEASINRIYGFYDECRRRYSVKLWKTFIDVFNYMPIAGLIESRIFCMHGGIPDIKDFSFDRIRRLERPITKNVPNESANSDERLITDLMWADPAWPQDSRDQGPVMLYGVNEQRQTSHVFGPDALAQFMDAHGLDLIARAHECVDDGFKFFSGPGHPMGCITIFSAPNYCGDRSNAAAVVSLDENLVASIQVLAPPDRLQDMKEGIARNMEGVV